MQVVSPNGEVNPQLSSLQVVIVMVSFSQVVSLSELLARPKLVNRWNAFSQENKMDLSMVTPMVTPTATPMVTPTDTLADTTMDTPTGS